MFKLFSYHFDPFMYHKTTIYLITYRPILYNYQLFSSTIAHQGEEVRGRERAKKMIEKWVYSFLDLECAIRSVTLDKSFYLHHCIVIYGVYTSFVYHTFLQPISKNFLAIKDIKKPFLHAKFQTDWFDTLENKSDSKLISVSGVWCNASKNG